jgi:uncharacterized membrane protein YhaH (DUF805 family)
LQVIELPFIIQALLKFIKNLFSGRINRLQYLFGSLFVALVLIVGITPFKSLQETRLFVVFGVIAFFVFSYSLVVRRVHDTGHAWYFMLLWFVPFVGFFFWLYILFQKGEIAENVYGQPPNNNRKFFEMLLNQ